MFCWWSGWSRLKGRDAGSGRMHEAEEPKNRFVGQDFKTLPPAATEETEVKDAEGTDGADGAEGAVEVRQDRGVARGFQGCTKVCRLLYARSTRSTPGNHVRSTCHRSAHCRYQIG